MYSSKGPARLSCVGNSCLGFRQVSVPSYARHLRPGRYVTICAAVIAPPAQKASAGRSKQSGRLHSVAAQEVLAAEQSAAPVVSNPTKAAQENENEKNGNVDISNSQDTRASGAQKSSRRKNRNFAVSPEEQAARKRAAQNRRRLLEIPGVGDVTAEKFLEKGYDFETLRKTCLNIKAEGGQEAIENFLQNIGIKNKHHLKMITNWAACAPQVTLSVEGNIGAGKSTFLNILRQDKVLQRKHELKVVPEPVDLWQNMPHHGINLLEHFYKDPKQHAFVFQQYVFLTRYIAERDSMCTDKIYSRVLERSVFSDRLVFVKASHRNHMLSDAELAVYDSWFDPLLLSRPTLVPDGFVYLRAGPDVCHERMRKRGRSEEGGVPLEYLETLHQNHEDWLMKGTLGKPGLEGCHESHKAALNFLHQSAGLGGPSMDEALRLYNESVKVQVKPVGGNLLEHVDLPNEIADQVYFLHSDKTTDWHPRLNWVPTLVIDYNQNRDVDNDKDFQDTVARKVDVYTDFLEEHKKALERLQESVFGKRISADTYTHLLGKQKTALAGARH